MNEQASERWFTGYLAAIASPQDELSTVTAALRYTVWVFNAQLGAVILEGAVRGYIGPNQGTALTGLVDTSVQTKSLIVDGIGSLHAVVAQIDDVPSGSIVLARKERPFTDDDQNILSGMAQALGLALRGLRTLATGLTMLAEQRRESEERLRLLNALGARQRLLEAMLDIQRSISGRKPLEEILDSVTTGAASLLDLVSVTLVLSDPQTGNLLPASSYGSNEYRDDVLTLTAAVKAMESNCVIAHTAENVSREYHSVIAAPVHVRGEVAGSLAVETLTGHGDTIEYRQLVSAFAQQASLALADARAADITSFSGSEDLAADHLGLIDDLHLALGRHELRLQYQPLVDIATGRPLGVEALARWRHPERGEVAPAVFIPLAEKAGLILDIGLWVLNEGCRQIAIWRQLDPNIKLNINVSASQILDHHFPAHVSAALNQEGLPGETLTLEFTETTLMDDPDRAMVQLQRLKKLHTRLSIDDFGTGYSSLPYLCKFPVDQLKIDRTFIAGASTDENQLAITQTIVNLGKSLRLEIAAEGIEEKSQLDLLRHIGCDLGQGFFIAKPMEPEAIHEYLTQQITPP